MSENACQCTDMKLGHLVHSANRIGTRVFFYLTGNCAQIPATRYVWYQSRRIPGGKVGGCPPWEKRRWARLCFCPPTYERRRFATGRLPPLLPRRGGTATIGSIMSVYNIGPCSGPTMKVRSCTPANRKRHLRDTGGPHADKEALWQI